jgi:hypothetical protein
VARADSTGGLQLRTIKCRVGPEARPVPTKVCWLASPGARVELLGLNGVSGKADMKDPERAGTGCANLDLDIREPTNVYVEILDTDGDSDGRSVECPGLYGFP